MRAFYDSKSKLDDRGIKELMSQTNKYRTWLEMEKVLAEAQAEAGLIPAEAAKEIAAIRFEDVDLEEVERIKEKVGHSFVPFLKVLEKGCGEEGKKYIHYGSTTQNIQQNTQLYIAKQVNDVFKSFLADILASLGRLAAEHADTVMAGRTHGRHAIPITYGYKVAVWINELLNSLERLEECEKRTFVVMMGGAVGGFNSIGAVGREVQDRVAAKLSMRPMTIPSRTMCHPKLEYLMNLSLICNTFHKMAEEVYYTGIEEFSEVKEAFTKGIIGSSAMPHKINPKLAKGIIANSQKLYSLPGVGCYSAVRMFEGDSSSYMLFDGIIDEALELVTEVLIRAEELCRGICVNKERMLENVNINGGLDNSEHIMVTLASRIGKNKAHELVYEKAMMAELNGRDYFEVLSEDETISAMFTPDEIRTMIDPASYTGICNVLALELSQQALAASAQLNERLGR